MIPETRNCGQCRSLAPAGCVAVRIGENGGLSPDRSRIDESARISVQGSLRRLRHPGAGRAHRLQPRRGGRRGEGHRRRRLGREGPGPRGRPRQGRRRQGRQGPRCGREGDGGHARPAAGHQADGARRPADPEGVRGDRLGDRARDLPLDDPEPGQGPHRDDRFGRRRHGHRGSRRALAREDHHGRHPPGRGPAALPVPPDGVRARLQGRADRAVPDHRDGALQALHREGRGAGRGQPADRHQGRLAAGARRQDQHRPERGVPPEGRRGDARHLAGRRDGAEGQRARPQLRLARRQHRLHGQRRRASRWRPWT